MADVATVVREHLRAEFMAGQPDLVLTDDTDLIEQEVLDSLGIFTLVAFLETRFGVQVEPSDVNLSNFETVRAISKLVTGKQAAP